MFTAAHASKRSESWAGEDTEVRSARWRAAESHGSGPQVPEFGGLADSGLRPATPPPLPFLSPSFPRLSFPTQCPQAGRKRSTNDLALPCTARA